MSYPFRTLFTPQVDVSRDPATLAMAPASITISLHCDTASSIRDALQHLSSLEYAAAPPQPLAAPSGSLPSAATSAAATPVAPGQGGVLTRTASSAAAALAAVTGPPSGRRAPSPHSHPWGPPSPFLMPGIASQSPLQQPQLQAPPSAAARAAEERRRRQLLKQHPGLGMLEAAPAKLATLRLYLQNPEFATLRPLGRLSHLQELSLVVSVAVGRCGGLDNWVGHLLRLLGCEHMPFSDCVLSCLILRRQVGAEVYVTLAIVP